MLLDLLAASDTVNQHQTCEAACHVDGGRGCRYKPRHLLVVTNELLQQGREIKACREDVSQPDGTTDPWKRLTPSIYTTEHDVSRPPIRCHRHAETYVNCWKNCVPQDKINRRKFCVLSRCCNTSVIGT